MIMAKQSPLDDGFNEHLIKSDWKNPKPKEVYDLVIIGGGPGGMTAATVASGFNARVAIIEKWHFGGESLSSGCIPSKALLRSSRCAAAVQGASEFGIDIPKGWKVNFAAVMERVRRLQGSISPHDSPEHFTQLGIDVFIGGARFIARNKVEVSGEHILRFKKAIISTGTRPLVPPLPGLEETGYLTNQTIFKLRSLPPRLAVIGGGPIGCELSQAFLRFGSSVALITQGNTLLLRDDPEATDRLQKVFEEEGMQIFLKTEVKRFEKKGKEKILHLDSGKTLIVDEILIAVGRAPNIEGLCLEKAGVEYDPNNGILTDDTLKTRNRNIFVVGAVGSLHKSTLISKELAKIAVKNALAAGKRKCSSMVIPWTTYTDPEVARLGLQEKEALDLGFLVQTAMIELKDIDRAILDGETKGFVKIHLDMNTGQVLGGVIIAKHASHMISELAVTMASQKNKITLSEVSHAFPTQAEAIRTIVVALVKAISKKNKKTRRKTA